MKRIVSFFALMALVSSSIQAIPDKPLKAMGKPKVFMNEKESYRWADIARSKNWGELSNNFWQVYIDRDGICAYERPSTSSKKCSDVKFMQAYYVAEIEGDFALLYEEKYVQSNLQISQQARMVGYVELKNLLLWTTCPRTRGQVYQKAVILKDPDDIQDKEDINEVSPYFLSSPVKMKDRDFYKTGARAIELEFYFVFKRDDNGAALLVAESKIDDPNALARVKRYGWMRNGNFTPWNERLCYEPNFGSPAIKYNAAVFKEKDDARNYKSTGEIGSNSLWHDKLPINRWSPKQTRFPVLDIDKNNYIAQIGTVGSAGGSGTSSEQAAELQKKIDEVDAKVDVIRNKMAQINVVFVIDGTSSMKEYYQPVARAIKDAMSRDAMQGANISFGAVVYRNYADGDNVVEMKSLTKDADAVASWLVSRPTHSEGKTHHEAMLHGLVTALDKMSWKRENANFLIHIGDAGNELPDNEKGYTLEAVAKKMAAKEINYIGFQANRLDHEAYMDFVTQMMKLMVGELKILWGGDISMNDFVDKGRLLEVSKSVKGNQIITAAYHFAELNRPENSDLLKDLVERKITEFKDVSNNEMRRFQRALDEMSGDARPAAAAEAVQFENIDSFLKDRGLTEEEIRTMKKKGVVLKIKGFTSRTANGKETFVPCVFMAQGELDELITNLAKISKSTSTNRRKDLQETLESLALSYIGQSAKNGNMTIDEIMDAVSGIRRGTGASVFGDIMPTDLPDPAKVPDNVLNEYISQISSDLDLLRIKRDAKDCYFVSPNGARYYYILMSDMPLQPKF